MKQTDFGILLHRISYSESSLITTFYTKTGGIQKYIFLGGKKKSGNLFPLGIYEITFYRRPDSELGKLNEVNLLSSIQEILNNPTKTVISFFIAEILHQTLKTDEADFELYNYIQTEINQLSEEEDSQLFPCLFLLRFIGYLGITPLVTNSSDDYFDLAQGEFTSNPKNHFQSISSISICHIRDYFLTNEINRDEFVKNRKEIVSILINYLTLHIPNFEGHKSLDLAKEILM